MRYVIVTERRDSVRRRDGKRSKQRVKNLSNASYDWVTTAQRTSSDAIMTKRA
jgi:hypothetical protein